MKRSFARSRSGDGAANPLDAWPVGSSAGPPLARARMVDVCHKCTLLNCTSTSPKKVSRAAASVPRCWLRQHSEFGDPPETGRAQTVGARELNTSRTFTHTSSFQKISHPPLCTAVERVGADAACISAGIRGQQCGRLCGPRFCLLERHCGGAKRSALLYGLSPAHTACSQQVSACRPGH